MKDKEEKDFQERLMGDEKISEAINSSLKDSSEDSFEYDHFLHLSSKTDQNRTKLSSHRNGYFYSDLPFQDSFSHSSDLGRKINQDLWSSLIFRQEKQQHQSSQQLGGEGRNPMEHSTIMKTTEDNSSHTLNNNQPFSSNWKQSENSVNHSYLDNNVPITLENEDSYGIAIYRLAKTFYDKSDLNQASHLFQRALTFCEKPKDSFLILKILGFLIRIASEMENHSMAHTYVKQSEQLMTELSIGLSSLSSEYFYYLGVSKTYNGDFFAAQENFLICFEKCKRENEPDLLSKCLLALADNAYSMEDLDKALDYVHQLEELLEILQKNYLLGALFFLTAKIFIQKGLYTEALEKLSNANSCLQMKQCWNLHGYILLHKGITHKSMTDYQTAQIYFTE